MLENYVGQIAFSVTALVCVFMGATFFKGGEGWVKTFKSGKQFSSKYEGFFWFIIGPIAVAILAPWLNSGILNFLTLHLANLIWILIGFVVIMWLYYCKKHGFKII